MATLDEAWHPPDAQEILMANIPDGSSWYELRVPLRTISYCIEQWDEAIGDAKIFKRLFNRAALYYCYKENGKLGADKVW